MLPLPAHAKTHGDYHRRQAIKLNHKSPHITLRESIGLTRFNLFARTRTTNLAVLLLATVAAISLFFIFTHYISSLVSSPVLMPHTRTTLGDASFAPAPIRIPRSPATTNLTHLVIVPCHSIFLGARPEDRALEESWVLSSFQRGRGRQHEFWKHIAEGARRVLKDEQALLVFSGGQTSSGSSFTEADSYLRLALLSDVFHPEAHNLASTGTTTLNHDRETESGGAYHRGGPLLADARPFERATTEPFALDSFQNLLFSIARFQHVTGHYPTHITIIGYALKRERFTTLHAPALRWPVEQLTYVGIGLDPALPEHEDAWKGEQAHALEPYKKDLYGCHGMLQGKRNGRNPASRVPSYGIPVLPSQDGLSVQKRGVHWSRDENDERTRLDGASSHGPPSRRGELDIIEYATDAEERRSLVDQVHFGRLLEFCPPSGRASERYRGPLPWDIPHERL